MTEVRVVLPAPLRQLASIPSGEIRVDVSGAVTQRSVLDAVEQRWPSLVGTLRDRRTGARRAFVRFYACQEDLSHEPPDAPLPAEVVDGREPYLVLGAMAGG